ncbi:MAG: HAMP domain-containing histidine kinase [Clostridiales bacterium]|nr:HAMP domain-containing histidine kinase [Clostridiales bacterium]
MFSKTKRKIVFTVVLSLVVLMAVTLSTIYVSNRIALRRESEEMLQTYAEQYGAEGQPGDELSDKLRGPRPEENFEGNPEGRPDIRPGEGDLPDVRIPDRKNEPKFRLSTFYSAAYSKDGELISVNRGNGSIYSEDDILEIADSAMNSGKQSGSRGSIYYLVYDKGDYTLVAMIDSTIDNSNQAMLIKEMLIIGSAALIILFIISIFIARRIVRPLEENDRRQKRFVSDAGHELKTPIAVISANSELLKRELKDNEWLSNIDYENEKMSELVTQLLLLSRAENSEIPKETLDFSKLVDGETLVFESLAFENGKRIETDIQPGLTVEGNSNQLKQLVSILLDNALSHGAGEEIRLTLSREKHFAVLTVSNGADEIGAEQLSRLFDRFYRADEARNDAGSHYGLGLSIAKAVTEAHGGQIRGEYRDGKMFFTISLPVKKSEKN